MIIRRPEGATRTLGQAQGFLGLPIRDEEDEEGIQYMVSVWEPTPAELAMLNLGGSVVLTVMGRNHPPVQIIAQPAPVVVETP